MQKVSGVNVSERVRARDMIVCRRSDIHKYEGGNLSTVTTPVLLPLTLSVLKAN